MLKEEFQKQRHFLHDISNKLSIAEGSLSYFLKKPISETDENYLKEAKMSQKYLNDSVKILKELRSFISELENKNN